MTCGGSGIYYAQQAVVCNSCIPIQVNYMTVGVSSVCTVCDGTGVTISYYGGYITGRLIIKKSLYRLANAFFCAILIVDNF